ncbi:hypothetical protein IL306_009143 [Fusarium sp. DS 682]|nr:hypothetical protein IL306_009143 [Fusarium sp. DS 682]
MVSSFKSLGSLSAAAGSRFHVCLASRHYPYITMRKQIEMVLECQEGHNQDISSYLNSELEIGDSSLANEVRVQIKERSSGIFMWVVLVTRIVQQKYDQGRIHELKQTLGKVPEELHELFRDIVTRDDVHKDELLLCIQWLLFARHPLKPEQLYFAIRSHKEPKTICKWDRDEIHGGVISKFILSSSKGLVEIARTRQYPTVQFIHELVRDFLLTEDGLSSIVIESGGNLEDEIHERLKKCCFEYAKSYMAEHGALAFRSKQRLVDVRATADKDFPFLRYAVRNGLYHAERAAERHISQFIFLQNFPLKDWIELNNLFEDEEVRRHSTEATMP